MINISRDNHKNIKYCIIIFLFIFYILLSVNTASANVNNSKVLFDETGPLFGKFFTAHNVGTYGSSGFAALLQQNGYDVSVMTDRPITAEKLSGYNVLIIMGQHRNYTDEEVGVIKDFVNNGGGLLLIGDTWGNVDGAQDYGVNKIAQGFGVSYANNEIVTNDQNYLFFYNIIKITNISSSPITANVPKFYYMMGTYIKNPGTSEVLAYTDSYTWGDQGYTTPDGQTESNYKKDTNETNGPLPVLSQMSYGNGKVVFMGGSYSFINEMLYRSDIWKLGLNSVSWLTNNPTPSYYKSAGIIAPNLVGIEIIWMLLLTVMVFSGLAFKLRQDRVLDVDKTTSTIKNWKFKVVIGLNVFFTILAGLLFIPIQFYIYNMNMYSIYDPNLGYTMLITGVLFLFCMGVILFNLVARQRMLRIYSYYNIIIIILFAGLTVFLGDIFGFPMMQLLTLASLVLLIPLIVNLRIHQVYGSDLIIEGKEFDRLKRLSSKSLPYELKPFFSEASYIGEGGFGRVFKATNKDGEAIALKIPKTFDKNAERSFITEVSNWSHLDHPHIVKLMGYKILPIPYIETEFCEGKLEKGMKPLKESVSIIFDIAKALEYSHNKNIIHGDVKLSNILIKNGVYKLSDWGLSKFITDESVTLSGATPAYCAPEQISIKFGKSDERTDIYQLGTVFYELLTGRLPFEGELTEIYNSILTVTPVNPEEINSNAQPVNDIIMKCLAKAKTDRYSSMGELIKELEKYMPSDQTLKFDE